MIFTVVLASLKLLLHVRPAMRLGYSCAGERMGLSKMGLSKDHDLFHCIVGQHKTLREDGKTRTAYSESLPYQPTTVPLLGITSRALL